jgi:hypothetical protein
MSRFRISSRLVDKEFTGFQRKLLGKKMYCCIGLSGLLNPNAARRLAGFVIAGFFEHFVKMTKFWVRHRTETRQDSRKIISKNASKVVKLRMPSPKPHVSPVLSPRSL